jgi:hypothetical protein
MHCLMREFLEEVLDNYSEQDTLRDYVRATRKAGGGGGAVHKVR